MDYLHCQDFLNAGDTVRVELDRQANVILMDNLNYSNYVNGKEFNCHKGLSTVSPYQIPVPYTGMWHIVIDLSGRAGMIMYSVGVIKK